jgi:DNA-directed RNA polymerase specialized sigma24 family protein
MIERKTRERRRREVLSGDLDRYEATRALWFEGDECSPARTVLLERVRAAVDSALTDKQREVVEACFFEGLSQGEIARRLGVAQQVVQKRLYGVDRRGRRVGGAMARLQAALGPLHAT